MSFKNKIVKGISWSAAERFLNQFFQIFMTIILARILSPSDFGIIAIVLVFTSISQALIDSGLSNALIQKSRRDQTDLSTVFFFNIIFGLLIYVLIFSLAPWLARLFNEPELESLLRILGLSPFIQGLSIIQITILTIKVDFKVIAKASVTSILISSVIALYLAFLGAGFWAIATQLLLHNTINTILLWIFVDWKPRLVFSWRSFKGLFSFGWKLLAAGQLHSMYVNSYNLVIGIRNSSADIGYFNQSSTISRFPSIGFMAIISRAVFPIQCELQDDKTKLFDSFKNYLQLSHFVIFPLMLAMAALSEPFISLVLTDKWLPMKDYFSTLCIAYCLTPIMVTNNQMLLVNGRSDLFLIAEIIKKIFGSIILLCTFSYGIKVICIGFVIYNIFDSAVAIYYSRKTTGAGYTIQIKWIYKSTISAICMLLAIIFSTSLVNGDLLKIFIGTVFGISTYLYFCHIFKTKLLAKLFPFGNV